MNILYIDHYAGSPGLGMEYRPYYLAREWQRLGHQVTIIAASFAHVRNRHPEMTGLYQMECVEGIPFVWLKAPMYAGNGLGRIVNMLTFLRRFRQWRRWIPFKPDIVIASSTYPMDIGPARVIARSFGAKLIWEVHDLWPLSPMELGGMPRWNPFIVWIQRYEDLACRVADAVVSLLPKADLHLTTRGMDPRKFHCIPNGIDSRIGDETYPIPPNISGVIEHAHALGKIVVVYAGAHGPANSLSALVSCALTLVGEPFLFLLVGSGPEKSRLQTAASGAKNIVFCDPIPKMAVDSVLRISDIAFIGLKKRGLFRFGISPNKIMDYMFAGVPIISAIAAGNDPVSEAECGLTIEPDSPADIAVALRTLANLSPEERSSLGRRGYDYIMQKQTYPVLAKRFLAIMRGDDTHD